MNGASGSSDVDGQAARVAETEAGLEGINIPTRAHCEAQYEGKRTK
ncbi:MAG TPA: hypothetical protein VIW07_00055 [Candidatus Udaeobacter sp.]